MGIGRHLVTTNTVGLWQLDGSLADSSGNGLTLSIIAGTARYSQFHPGFKTFYFDGATRIGRAIHDAALSITGDLTILFLFELLGFYPVAVETALISFFGSNNTTQANNSQYYLYIPNGQSYLAFRQRAGSPGVDSIAANTTGKIRIGQQVPHHIALTRIANIPHIYLNGRLIFTGSALTTPDGGSSAVLTLGGSSVANGVEAAMGSVKILNVGYSAAQVVAEYNQTLGAVFGVI